MSNVIKLIVLISFSLLIACGPAVSPTEAPTNIKQISPVATLPPLSGGNSSDSPLATPTPEASGASRGGATELSWNSDPASKLISATFCCGFTPQVVLMNYIADATVWGDGQIIWVEQADDGTRRVLTGTLSSEQISGLLQQAAEAGFFDWDSRYADQTVADAAEKCLRIDLAAQSKQVCEYVRGAPPAFHDLYAQIAGGAGATGRPYAPERGYLTATPLDLVGDSAGSVGVEWFAKPLGFSLSEATGGKWVEGEILKMAWDIVNENWPNTIVQEGQTVYEISVQLPGLSKIEPPTP